jgi:hypothetical protein
MRKWWIFIVLVILVTGAGYAGWRLAWYDVFVPEGKVSSTIDPVLPLTVESEKVNAYIAQIVEPEKPSKINVEFSATMPASIEDTFATLPGASFGNDGEGIACGFPKYENNGAKVKLTIYTTMDKLLLKVGKEKVSEDLNKLVKYCLAYAVFANNNEAKQAALLANDSVALVNDMLVTLHD